MAVLLKLREYLDSQKIRYQVIQHSIAFTAQELAATMHVAGQEMAKTVIVKSRGQYHMVVLPATRRIDFTALQEALSSPDVSLATEKEFEGLFPGCEAGAMPPFGNLFGLPVVASRSLAEDDEIVFNAGTHTDAVRMKWADFEQLVKPKIARIGEPANP